MMKWWIGCSGFHYKHWKEVFYPHGLAQTKWFSYYCTQFKTLELNVTFYRFPELSFLESWYSRSPEDFSFSVKAPRSITHYKKFHGTNELITSFYNVVREGLKDKLGCILFQLPPGAAYTEERLDRIINSLDPDFNNVLEFRDMSWWNAGVYNKLSKHKIIFCGMSHPILPEEIIQNTSILYYRMHGKPDLYKSSYTIAELEQLADAIEASGKTKKAFIFFNNDIDASAIRNAREMIAYCLPEKV